MAYSYRASMQNHRERTQEVLYIEFEDMESHLALFTFFSFLLIGSSIDARPDPAEYWRGVMKDEPMPEAIEGLFHESKGSVSNNKPDCTHTSAEAKTNDNSITKDFEPRPNASAYHDDQKLEEESKSFVKDFEPRPNLSAYGNDADLKGEKSIHQYFEPRPNILFYQG